MNYSEIYKVKPRTKIDPSKISTLPTGNFPDKNESLQLLAENIDVITKLQYKLYAENKRSILVVLQAMDAGGKDGTIRHVFAPLNPQGCRVTSFKVPSAMEVSHDFLWRCHLAAPSTGEIMIFNRSYYEDVLVTRVHGKTTSDDATRRYKFINDFESMLTAENNTVILKFFLHISKSEQLERFKARIENPEKQWKITMADCAERQYWSQYQQLYGEIFENCSPGDAPWFIIPADKKWYRDLAISSIFREVLEKMELTTPPPSPDLEAVKEKLFGMESQL